MFRGSELPRLTAALTMLVLLFLLFLRLRDPNTWTWFASNRSSSSPAREADATGPSAAAAVDGEARAARRATAQSGEKSSAPRATDSGAADQDPDEAHEAAMEFQAVTDGTLELQREEMVPYNRIVRWVQDQSFDSLLHRARSDLLFRQLYQSPGKYRGKLVTLELNVRQIVDAGKNDNGVPLWEVIGWTNESKAWLYWAVVLDLPKDMPTGAHVSEKAKFVGYFFKLQGYHEAGAKPNAAALKAPLLIGRLQWQPVAAAVPTDRSSQTIWGMALLAGVGAVIALQFAYSALRRQRRANSARHHESGTATSTPIEDWLDHPGDSRSSPGQLDEQ
jgi:hypothetical protein